MEVRETDLEVREQKWLRESVETLIRPLPQVEFHIDFDRKIEVLEAVNRARLKTARK